MNHLESNPSLAPTKPAYAWSCLACGSRNDAGSMTCGECGCAARSTVAGAAAFRAKHVSRGGVVHAGAALAATADDPTAGQLLWWAFGPVVRLVGWLA